MSSAKNKRSKRQQSRAQRRRSGAPPSPIVQPTDLTSAPISEPAESIAREAASVVEHVRIEEARVDEAKDDVEAVTHREPASAARQEAAKIEAKIESKVEATTEDAMSATLCFPISMTSFPSS